MMGPPRLIEAGARLPVPRRANHASSGGNVFGIGVRTETSEWSLSSQRGIAAEVPLRADVGPGAEDDVKAFLLRFADVFGDVVLAG